MQSLVKINLQNRSCLFSDLYVVSSWNFKLILPDIAILPSYPPFSLNLVPEPGTALWCRITSTIICFLKHLASTVCSCKQKDKHRFPDVSVDFPFILTWKLHQNSQHFISRHCERGRWPSCFSQDAPPLMVEVVLG